MTNYGFVHVPVWEYDAVIESGIYKKYGDSGIAIFVEKEDACDAGKKAGTFKIFDETVEMELNGETHKIPVIGDYDHFYIASIDLDLLDKHSNKAPQLAAFEGLPMLWFTTEPIPTICIIHTEKIPI